MPLDVRKGFAFPTEILSFIRGAASDPEA